MKDVPYPDWDADLLQPTVDVSVLQPSLSSVHQCLPNRIHLNVEHIFSRLIIYYYIFDYRYTDLLSQRHRPWRSGGAVRPILWSWLQRVLQGRPQIWKHNFGGKVGQRGKTCQNTWGFLIFNLFFNIIKTAVLKRFIHHASVLKIQMSFSANSSQNQDSIDVLVSITDGQSKVQHHHHSYHPHLHHLHHQHPLLLPRHLLLPFF